MRAVRPVKDCVLTCLLTSALARAAGPEPAAAPEKRSRERERGRRVGRRKRSATGHDAALGRGALVHDLQQQLNGRLLARLRRQQQSRLAQVVASLRIQN